MFSKRVLFTVVTLFSLRTCQGYSPDFLKEYPILNNLYITLHAKSREPKLYSSRIGYILTGIADKKSQERLNSFLQAVHAYQEQNQIPDAIEMSLYRDTELLIMSVMCIKQIEILYKDLIQLLNNCLIAQEYWKQLKQNSFRKFLVKRPFGLTFAQKNELSTDDILQCLDEQIKKFTHYLGNLYYQWRQFSSVENNHQLAAHIQKTIIIIHGCLGRIEPENLTNLASQKTEADWLTVLPKHWPALATYRKNALESLKVLQPVSFARHYWFDCVCLAVASAAATWYWYNNQESLQKIQQNTLDAGTNFYQSYIQDPIKLLWDTLYAQQNSSPAASIAEGKAQEQSLANIYAAYYKHKNPHTPFSKIQQIAQEEAKNRNTGYFEQNYEQAYLKLLEIDWTNWRNVGTILQTVKDFFLNFALFGQRAKLGLHDTLSIADDLRLIKVLAMNIPVYLSFSIAKKVVELGYKKIVSKTVVYTAIHTLLIKVERVLNQCNNQTGAMNFETQGLLLYWLHRLTNCASKIPTKYRVDFEKDILEIASPEFETNQKLGTLHRMYRAYPFLQAPVGN